jgi:hypothetical protein
MIRRMQLRRIEAREECRIGTPASLRGSAYHICVWRRWRTNSGTC